MTALQTKLLVFGANRARLVLGRRASKGCEELFVRGYAASKPKPWQARRLLESLDTIGTLILRFGGFPFVAADCLALRIFRRNDHRERTGSARPCLRLAPGLPPGIAQWLRAVELAGRWPQGQLIAWEMLSTVMARRRGPAEPRGTTHRPNAALAGRLLDAERRR
jgi:hypothetical protein